MPSTLKSLVRSRNPLISIETRDEEHALELVRQIAGDLGRPLYEWSMTTGMRVLDKKGAWQPIAMKLGKTLTIYMPIAGQEDKAEAPKPQLVKKAVEALTVVVELPNNALYVFKDLGPHAKDAHVQRLLRDAASSSETRRSTVLLVDSGSLPDEVQRLAIPFEIGWPSLEELEEVVKQTFSRIRKESYEEVTATLTRKEMDHLVQTLRGLTRTEAERVIASVIYQDFKLNGDDLPAVLDAKRALLGSAGSLESIAVDFTIEDVGGFENLKAWLKQRRGGFSKKAREFGLVPPRGILILGVPGCGKSLCAKAVAADWQMPLLRLDPGVLYNKFIGETERLLRDALAQAEAMAPVILWIDEIEKAFASASGGSGADGGLSKRMFGSLLSWMQDHRHPIFLVATANDISALPPELMRKGRFDEVFFVDLPTFEARMNILLIHLVRRERDPAQFDLVQLAEASEGFNGAELEQAILGAMYGAYQEGGQLEGRHILEEMSRTRPLSVLMAERITELRDWAADRCVSAD
jgi:AAA+ superfamily predicted ATPase